MCHSKFSFYCVLALLCALLVSPAPSLAKVNSDPPRAAPLAPPAHDLPGHETARVVLPAPPLAADSLAIKDGAYKRAYADAYNILSEQNACSQFFRGPVAAVEVFNLLAQRITKDVLANDVGLRMGGGYTLYYDHATDITYRLFNRQVVNLNGAFYRPRSTSPPRVSDIGSFAPNTRPARVLMLLHELGHLLAAPDRHWLLPNDGDNQPLSEQNTRTVEQRCGEQLRNLK